MGASPNYKVFNPAGEYIAATVHLEDAAAIVALYGKGASIRDGHAMSRTLWVDGSDGSAADSYDRVVVIALERMHELMRKAEAERLHRIGQGAVWSVGSFAGR